MSQEQKRNEASQLILELAQHAIARGAYSSVEVKALKEAIGVVTRPVVDDNPPEELLPTES